MNKVPRWLTWIFALMLLILASGGAWFLRIQEQRQRADVEANLEAIALLKVDQIAQWRFERLADAAVLMENPFIHKALVRCMLDPQADASEPILSVFRSLQKHYRYFDVLLVDTHGQVRSSLTGRKIPINEETLQTIAVAFKQKRAVLSDLHAGDGELPPRISVVAPFFAADAETAEPIGAVLLQSDARVFFFPLIQSWPTPSRSAETLLVRRDNDSVLFLNDLRHQPETAIKRRLPLTGEQMPSVMAVLGKEGMVEGKDYRGIEVLAVIKPIPDTPWLMVAKIDTAEALAAWRWRSVLILALMVGFMAAAATAGGMVWQHYAKERYRALFHAEAALRESEELRYRTTLISIGDAVIVTDAQGRVRLLNPVAEALTGWGSQEALGKSVNDVFRIVDEETHRPGADPVARVLAEGVLVGLANHSLLIARDGRQIPIADSGAPITDETGAVSGVVLVFRDQTESRQAEAALQAFSARQQALLAAIPDIIMEVDADKVYAWANQAGLDFFGQDVIGRPASHYFEGGQDTLEAIQSLFDGRESEVYAESWQRRRDGQKRLLSAWWRGLKNSSGKVYGALCSARDMTQNKQAENVVRVRLNLLEFATAHSLEELLQKTLDEVGALTSSPIGFYHFVETDQETLSLRAWSTQTLEKFCRTKGKDLHYPISRAGVWVDCVHVKRPVIHNDYAALSHRKGMPEGHAALIRELVVPILRSDRVVAILGIGNKPTDYTQEDVELVCYLADVAWEISIRKLEEKKRQQSEESYRLLVQNIPGVVYKGFADGGVEFFDDKIMAVTGYPVRDFTSRKLKWEQIVQPEDLAQAKRIFLQALRAERGYIREYRIRRRDGKQAWIQERSQIVCHANGCIDHISGVLFDVTERKNSEQEKEKLEAKFRQAQKMEAVGRLAGGVAHDFNNMLGVILGYTELTLAKLKPFDPIYADLKTVQSAASRSADLTRQLLAFSRKQNITPCVLDLNAQTKAMGLLLSRIIGEDIEPVFGLSEELWPVYMDPAQVDQIVANLAVNSRDAMPEGGKLTVKTTNITIDDSFCKRYVGSTPGDYVMLVVSDTGCGMDKETLEHVFEPFYTTKPEGKGTGLGLATVYGIVKQNNGFVDIYSEAGQGTTVKIYIPRYAGQEATLPVPVDEEKPKGGQETVLLVEDESQLRKLAKTMLEKLGYIVLEASSPGEAIVLCEKQSGAIHLLLTDVVMPNMNGKELEGRIRAMKPGIKVIFMSGYTTDVIVHLGQLEQGAHFLQKPFTLDALAKKVRQALLAA
jgi:two-component system cell cycle sensor histidine kinase/response regulator CckA